LKILFDHQAFTIQRYGGISRYFFELLSRFDSHENYELSCLFSNNEYLKDNRLSNQRYFFNNISFKGKERIINFLNEKRSLYNINRHNYDIFHPTYYSNYFLNNTFHKPFVITCYDMIHEKFSDKFIELKNDKVLIKNKEILLRNASKIIAISECTKKDIIDFYNIESSKIEVIYLGSNLKLETNPNQFLIPNFDYLLFVGNRGLYKNFIKLINSIRELLINFNIKMICAGGGSFNNLEKEFINNLELNKHLIYLPILNDSYLSNLYNNSKFFIFPSLYEGFGIPILEAFACKTPVLASKAGSLFEIGDIAADYFDPYDDQSIYTATKSLIFDTNRRNELISLGYERLNLFSFDKTYHQTLGVYKSLLY
jgi:glycosyltransferase involved in cell wall biosynthesis